MLEHPVMSVEPKGDLRKCVDIEAWLFPYSALGVLQSCRR